MNLPPHESRIKLPSATAAGLIGRDQVWFELAPAELIITMAEQKGRIEREPFFQEGRAGHLLGRLERKCTYGGVGGDLQVLPQSNFMVGGRKPGRRFFRRGSRNNRTASSSRPK